MHIKWIVYSAMTLVLVTHAMNAFSSARAKHHCSEYTNKTACGKGTGHHNQGCYWELETKQCLSVANPH